MAPRIATREEWLAQRQELLEAEKAHTRQGDELAARRRELPWVPIDKDYRFQTEDGPASLPDLFRGRSQLVVVHFMFPGCPSCSSVADGYDGIVTHLENHDVAWATVARYPIEELTAYKERMGWSFPFVSSLGSSFGFDFGVAYTDDEIASGTARHNLHTDWDHAEIPTEPFRKSEERPPKDLPGMSTFCPAGRRRLPHLFGLRARHGRAVGDVAVAGPRAGRAGRADHGPATPRRVSVLAR
jgi:predicted dithiol-disulfide oxidoreductase (DUF899 family)